MDGRINLLDRWASGIVGAAGAGALTRNRKPLRLRSVQTVRGPRAGALEIDAGLDSGQLLKVLSVNECALHRQFVPWDFKGAPSVYMTGRCVRLEAGWPDTVAEKDIPLKSLGQHPTGAGRWIAGKNEMGATVTLGIDDTKPHYLFGGWTGSGKTWALRSALAQLSQDPENRLVLIDCKWGDGLGALAHLPGLVGPVAMDAEAARAALSWAVTEMRNRYETGDHSGRVIVAIDEVQELTGKSGDPAITEMLRQLVVKGRGARVHVLVGTQHPTIGAFTDPTIKRNLTGRVALRTEDYKASEVVVGGPTPRADHLLGAGDSYAIVPGAVHRVQLAYLSQSELDRMQTGTPALKAWPEFDPEAAGTLPENAGGDAPKEVGAALIAAHLHKGRPWLRERLKDSSGSMPGGDKARRLLREGRELYDCLLSDGWTLAEFDRLTD